MPDIGIDPMSREEAKKIYYLELNRKYRLENRDKYNEYQKLYRRKQLEDPNFRLQNRIYHKQWREKKKSFNNFENKSRIDELFN